MTSVVVPVYNAGETLRRTVPSMLALAGVDEWVWVDDGSTDATGAFLDAALATAPSARVVTLGTNRGRAAARNAGIAASNGETVIFLDADVEPPPNAARRLAEAAALDGAVAAVARIASVLDAPDDPYQDYLAHYPRGPGRALDAGATLDWRFFLSGACALRRPALDQVGPFREDVRYGEDVALACRLARLAPDGLRLAGATIRLHDVGRLADALDRAGAFGQGLRSMSPACRRRALGRVASIPGASRAVGFGEPVLRRAVQALEPGAVRRRAVRYLLAARTLNALHRA